MGRCLIDFRPGLCGPKHELREFQGHSPVVQLVTSWIIKLVTGRTSRSTMDEAVELVMPTAAMRVNSLTRFSCMVVVRRLRTKGDLELLLWGLRVKINSPIYIVSSSYV